MMGENLVVFYKQRLRKEHKQAFFAAFFIGLLVHIYKFTNDLPNNDTVFNYFSYQNIVKSGRWALSPACAISSFFDLPWVIGCISCIYIALTVVVIVELFKIKNPVLIFLISGILAASPATTETFFYEYTADGYMLAMLLSACAAYLSRIDEKRVSRQIISAALVCLSCAIYQAYLAFSLILSTCYFIYTLLENRNDNKTNAKWILRQAIIYISSLVSYYIIWKIILKITGYRATTYMGISSAGDVSGFNPLRRIIRLIKEFIKYFIHCNPFTYGWSLYTVLGILSILAIAAAFIIALCKSKVYKHRCSAILCLCAIIALLPFSGIFMLISDGVACFPRMQQSLSLLVIFAAILIERWAPRISIKNVVCLLFALVVFDNSIVANVCYYQMSMCYENTYAEALEMNNVINEYRREYGVEKLAILGTRSQCQNRDIDYENQKILSGVKLSALSGSVYRTLIIDGEHAVPFLQHTFGMDMTVPTSTEQHELWADNEVREMKNWPDKDSVKVIGDVLVIKLSDEEAELRKTAEDEWEAANRSK